MSLPTRRDVNLQMWCQGEAAEPGTFVRKATLRGGSDRTRNKATQQEQDKANADAAAANAVISAGVVSVDPVRLVPLLAPSIVCFTNEVATTL